MRIWARKRLSPCFAPRWVWRNRPALTARVLSHFGASSVEGLLYRFHNRRHPAPGGLDRLAPILLDEAEAGDGVALRIVREHGKTLGDIALAAARRVEIEHTPFHLVLAGGVFRHPTTTFEEAIIARVRLAAPESVRRGQHRSRSLGSSCKR